MRATGLPVIAHWKLTVAPATIVVGEGVVVKPGRPGIKDNKCKIIGWNIIN